MYQNSHFRLSSINSIYVVTENNYDSFLITQNYNCVFSNTLKMEVYGARFCIRDKYNKIQSFASIVTGIEYDIC